MGFIGCFWLLLSVVKFLFLLLLEEAKIVVSWNWEAELRDGVVVMFSSFV